MIINKFRKAYVCFRLGSYEVKTNYQPRKDYDSDLKCPFCVELSKMSFLLCKGVSCMMTLGKW